MSVRMIVNFTSESLYRRFAEGMIKYEWANKIERRPEKMQIVMITDNEEQARSAAAQLNRLPVGIEAIIEAIA